MKLMSKFIFSVNFILLLDVSARAQTANLTTETPPPEQTFCGAKEFHTLDFLIGDWLVYEHGDLMEIDHVEKRQRGCWLYEEGKWINDKYRRPGQTFKFQESSIFAFSNDEWTMMSLDVMGGAFISRGAVSANGVFEFRSIEPRKGLYIKGTIERLSDGSLKQAAFASKDAEGKSGWTPMLEYISKRIN